MRWERKEIWECRMHELAPGARSSGAISTCGAGMIETKYLWAAIFKACEYVPI